MISADDIHMPPLVDGGEERVGAKVAVGDCKDCVGALVRGRDVGVAVGGTTVGLGNTTVFVGWITTGVGLAVACSVAGGTVLVG
jgi:hypothetical protein